MYWASQQLEWFFFFFIFLAFCGKTDIKALVFYSFILKLYMVSFLKILGISMHQSRSFNSILFYFFVYYDVRSCDHVTIIGDDFSPQCWFFARGLWNVNTTWSQKEAYAATLSNWDLITAKTGNCNSNIFSCTGLKMFFGTMLAWFVYIFFI